MEAIWKRFGSVFLKRFGSVLEVYWIHFEYTLTRFLEAFWIHFFLEAFWIHLNTLWRVFWKRFEYIFLEAFWLQMTIITSIWIHFGSDMTTKWLQNDYKMNAFWKRLDAKPLHFEYIMEALEAKWIHFGSVGSAFFY